MVNTRRALDDTNDENTHINYTEPRARSDPQSMKARSLRGRDEDQGPPSSGRNLRSAAQRLRSRPIIIDDEEDDQPLQDMSNSEDSDDSSDHAPAKAKRRHLDNSERSEQRYPTRTRRPINLFDEDGLADSDLDAAVPGRQRDRETRYRARMAQRGQVGQETSSESADEEEEEDDDQEDAEHVPRKTYSLRDRSKVVRVPQPAIGERPGSSFMRRSGSARGQAPPRMRRGGAAEHVLQGLFGGGWSPDAIQDIEGPPPVHWQALAGDLRPHANWGPAEEGRARLGDPLGGPSGAAKQTNAEITPVAVDTSISFSDVGGLDHYIRALKEMVFLPLVYPELFERFSIAPPRGVLFYGPPGTGKTLVARALAATASRAGRKVSFFMRKGADVLSKWVGESERQLRLLFDEAVRHQPSIIFFDEIDGLAPVRSSKQDQIHSSIVSTLLALMDGLDSRGQVVVVGATNRIDAIDGALRRPGRFDRELLFPLPNLAARRAILNIHTRAWSCKPEPALCEALGRATAGYCGADIKALCTEAALHAMRRCYPQIYASDAKLLVDPSTVQVVDTDFQAALRRITPASHRAAAADARPLSTTLVPLLHTDLDSVLQRLQELFPPAVAAMQQPEESLPGSSNAAVMEGPGGGLIGDAMPAGRPTLLLRPRLLVCGPKGAGQGHVARAVLHALEGLPLHAIGLSSLLADAGARSAEEALVHAVTEARRAAPAVLFLPHLESTLWSVLEDLPSELPLLLIATADCSVQDLAEECPEALQLFASYGSGVYALGSPGATARSAFFKPLCDAMAAPPLAPKQAAAVVAELPLAPEEAAREAQAQAEAAARAARVAYERDQGVLRALRQGLREVTYRLIADRRWQTFVQPVEDPDYWSKVQEPMDLATILVRVDRRVYATPDAYIADIARIHTAMQAYITPAMQREDVEALRAVSASSALVDAAQALVMSKVPDDLAALCREMDQRGGPAPKPDGVDDSVEEAIRGAAARQEAALRDHGGDRGGRRTTRLQGGAVEDDVFIRAAAREEAAQHDTDAPTSPEAAPLPAQQPVSAAKDDIHGVTFPLSASKASLASTPAAQHLGETLPDSLPPSTRGRSRLAVVSPPSRPSVPSPAPPIPRAVSSAAEALCRAAVAATEGQLVDGLEGLYGCLSRVVLAHEATVDRIEVVREGQRALEAWQAAK